MLHTFCAGGHAGGKDHGDIDSAWTLVDVLVDQVTLEPALALACRSVAPNHPGGPVAARIVLLQANMLLLLLLLLLVSVEGLVGLVCCCVGWLGVVWLWWCVCV